MFSSSDALRRAREAGLVVPAFNIPYLPMLEPVARAVVDQDAFALIAVARLEWEKFEARSPAAVLEEFGRHAKPGYLRLHLDHVPVVDEDQGQVDYLAILREAIALGYQSVMVDASRLDLAGNIAASRAACDLAHAAGVPCEAELGAVMGHEAGPLLLPYETLYESGQGFTDVAEATRFVRETACDWLSVAIGNVHGAISQALKDRKKVEAHLNIAHLERLSGTTGIPLVLHGGSSVRREYLLEAIRHGIAKVNIGTEIRQAYEVALREKGTILAAQDAVYERTTWLLRDYLALSGTRSRIVL